MENEQDWRLMGQERYLADKVLVWKTYSPPEPHWDHDHCEFCWRKFTATVGPDTFQEGYVTEDNQHWICPDCFTAFQMKFNWVVQRSS